MKLAGHRRRNGKIAPLLAGLIAALLLLAAQSGFWSGGPGTAAAQGAEPDATQQDIACTDCHREHQGSGTSLTKTADRACQSCHTEVEHFASGHPDFETYPHDRRTRINFDHVGHDRKHFADAADAPERCVECHERDSRGEQILVKGFENACADCHAGEIRGEGIAGSAGVAVVAVPGLDLPSLREAGAAIGGWPELSDRKLTPFMRAVFAGDPELRHALDRFDELDPLDLRDAAPGDIEAVATIAWATKTLFHDLTADGPAALEPKLSAALDRELGETATREMLGGITLATVREARDEWFPNLFEDLARHRAGQRVPIPASELGEPTDSGTDEEPADGQEDILGEESGDKQESILGEDSGDSQESILGDDSGDSQESILGDDSGDSQESILGDDSGDSQESILGDDSGDSQESILGDDSGDSQESILGEEPGGEEGADVTVTDAAPPQPNPERWARLGGWYRDYFALYYRPSDHADRFLKRWLDTTAAATGSGAGSVATPIFDQLAADNAPGKCVKCHSVDSAADGTVSVNWQGGPRPSPVKRLTQFAHDPHLSLLTEDDGCATCHAFDIDAEYLTGFEDRDPSTYQSNFQPITKSACADCHTAERAGNACIQCHEYHIGHDTADDATTTMSSMSTSDR